MVLKIVLQKPCPTEVLHQAIMQCLHNTTSTTKPLKAKKRLKGISILVAEDNNINQLVINKILASEGALVTIANNGEETLEIITQSNDIKIILMDIHMPKMDGVKATKMIRANKDNQIAQLPIVALTANVIENDVESYLSAGMNAHESKPIDKESLVKTIMSLVS